MQIFGSVEHEQVVLCQDPTSGLRAVIAIFSTALGPALGGTRFRPYAGQDAAVADALALSKAMAYKAACAGLDLGGGKAVILGDPATDKSRQLLLAYGRFVASLGGRYVTACDVGTFPADMDVVSEVCSWTTGRSAERGGAGDSGVLTAFGVFQGLRACAEQVWGMPSLAGRRVGVEGVGKVGRVLVRHLIDDGAEVVVSDAAPTAVAAVLAEHPQVRAADVDDLPGLDLDAYCPCAMGGSLTEAVVGRLRARVVCGAANNQLAAPEVAELMAARDVVYAPDFVVNAGGLIQVAEEIGGYDPEQARLRAAGIFERTLAILAQAAAEGVTPEHAADRMAERRIRSAAAQEPAGRSFNWPPHRRPRPDSAGRSSRTSSS